MNLSMKTITSDDDIKNQNHYSFLILIARNI